MCFRVVAAQRVSGAFSSWPVFPFDGEKKTRSAADRLGGATSSRPPRSAVRILRAFDEEYVLAYTAHTQALPTIKEATWKNILLAGLAIFDRMKPQDKRYNDSVVSCVSIKTDPVAQ